MRKITRITFPNQNTHDEVFTFKLEDFDEKSLFDECVFGWWKDIYVKVNREDYDKLKEDEQVTGNI